MTQMSFQDILQQQIHIPTILLQKYKSLGLNETDVMVILQLFRFQQENKHFPTPMELANCLTINEQECAHVLRRLIQKGFLKITQTKREAQPLTESYCLEPLWEKLFIKQDQPAENENEGTIFILFEQEFGRPLSPFEIETINAWLDQDHIAPELIKAGLRESVLMGKLNFKYIDRILRDWQKKGIRTVEQAREASKSFRDRQVNKQYQVQKRDTSFYYNWLEGED